MCCVLNAQHLEFSVIHGMLTAKSGLVGVDIRAACRGIDTSQWMQASTMHALRAQLVVNVRQTARSRRAECEWPHHSPACGSVAHDVCGFNAVFCVVRPANAQCRCRVETLPSNARVAAARPAGRSSAPRKRQAGRPQLPKARSDACKYHVESINVTTEI